LRIGVCRAGTASRNRRIERGAAAILGKNR
jgi:hypothetical protein